MNKEPFRDGSRLYCTQCGYELIKHGVSIDYPKFKYYCSNCGCEYIRNNTYDYVAHAVRSYWKVHYPQDMVAFFFQKYGHESEWEWREELIQCEGSDDYENLTFVNDFCEGQTDVKCLTVIPLEQVLHFYSNKHRNLKN